MDPINWTNGPRIASLVGDLEAFASVNGQAQPILGRWVRTVERRVVVAVRMIRAIEVDDVDAGGVAIEIEIASGRVRFGAARQIGKRHEEVIDVRRADLDKRGELERLALQAEFERADAPHLPLGAH